MIEEIEYMSQMVTDLLELSRLEAKAKTLELDSVDVYALTQSVLGRMKGLIEEKGLQVIIDEIFPSKVDWVSACKSQIIGCLRGEYIHYRA